MLAPHMKDQNRAAPYLEYYPEPGGHARRVSLAQFPFRIGRSAEVQYTVYSRQVSKIHAEITRRGEAFTLCDLGSRNGTFVNGERIAETTLNHGDIIHIADMEFQFGCDPPRPTTDEPSVTEYAGRQPVHHCQGGKLLRELLAGGRIRTLFHPIVQLETLIPIAYEALGRGDHPGLPPNPIDLFRLAEQHRLASELSRLFRVRALEDAAQLPDQPLLFVNLHPSEMDEPSMFASLPEAMPEDIPCSRLILEVHEDAVADPARLMRLREEAMTIGCGIAYDDFGAGQSRLAELADAPPDFVKLDRKLIQDIGQSEARQEIIRTLVRVSHSLGCRLIAEGIEKPDEAEVCRQLGCQLGQGFLFGPPQPARLFSA
jgi:EAL domain-containing protein (putative c-di-GMP-specific phosphodiesterase class I)